MKDEVLEKGNNAYININLPFFKLNFNVPITGETRKIERINR